MFDVESIEGAIVAAALTAGPRFELVQRNELFRELFPDWRPGQEAELALQGHASCSMLRALRSAGTGRPGRILDLPAGDDSDPHASTSWVVSCVPVSSGHGPSTLLLVVRVPDIAALRHVAADRDADLARCEALLSASHQVAWRMTRGGDIYTLAGSLGGDFGKYDPAQSLRLMRERIHLKDRSLFDSQWDAAVHGDGNLDIVVRVKQGAPRPGYRHVRVTAVPVLRGGEVEEWIGTATNVEDRWRLEARDHIMKYAVKSSSARELPDIARIISDAVVPDLADAFIVFPIEISEQIRPVSEGLSAESAQAALAPNVPDFPQFDGILKLGPLATKAISSQDVQLLVFPPGEPPEDAVSAVTRCWLIESQATSLVCIPVIVDERTMALAVACTCLGNPPLGDSDLGLAADILQVLRGPLRRALELQRLRENSWALQRSFLITPPRIDGAEISAVYQPTSATSEIGGDWYDAMITRNGAVALSIGDVAGHDLAAATEMTKISSMLRAFAYVEGDSSPADTLCKLDQASQGVSDAALITAVHSILTWRERERCWDVALSVAGHPSPLLIPVEGSPRYLSAVAEADIPLCVAPDARRRNQYHKLKPGETLLLYTDGLIEEPGADIDEGMGRLANHAADLRKRELPLGEFVAALLSAVGDASDDIALIAFRASNDAVK
ncbi:SpoIIE family protein phosphatase [Streptomyces sp. NPDC094038]|uniref:SpoIIE family protein phosphatase n=1 Tax=Streptomyces sp. NPDC094038 TaxID=3366055 RepID=UPI00382CADAA